LVKPVVITADEESQAITLSANNKGLKVKNECIYMLFLYKIL